MATADFCSTFSKSGQFFSTWTDHCEWCFLRNVYWRLQGVVVGKSTQQLRNTYFHFSYSWQRNTLQTLTSTCPQQLRVYCYSFVLLIAHKGIQFKPSSARNSSDTFSIANWNYSHNAWFPRRLNSVTNYLLTLNDLARVIIAHFSCRRLLTDGTHLTVFSWVL